MNNIARNNGTNTVKRRDDGTFAPGNPGRPKGSRHKTTRAIEALLDGEGEALSRKAVDLALKGDTTALRLCLDRIARFKRPRDYVAVNELPKNNYGKVLKTKLRMQLLSD